ncbi:MAG: riboflavin synthase, partial [Pseudomonadota bacterium]
FTGIIQTIGNIESTEPVGGDLRLTIGCSGIDLGDSQLGDSIAVNGVCLTAIEITANSFVADVSVETIEKTSLSQLKQGSPVNLEKALTLNTALGGHLVSGHVDGLATLIEMDEDARSIRYRFEVDSSLQHYIATKGSVTLDGTSLTVNHVDSNHFEVNIVPHTQVKTLFQYYKPGDRVNLEVDIIARYLERLIQGRADDSATKDQQILQTLIKSGFVNDK